MNLLVWLVVIGLLILLAKRILGGLVGVLVFLGAIFFAIFMLDTFTIINVRDYADVGFYDKTVENPKEALNQTVEAVKEGSSVAVNKINDMGAKLTNRYDTNSIVQSQTGTQSPAASTGEKKQTQTDTLPLVGTASVQPTQEKTKDGKPFFFVEKDGLRKHQRQMKAQMTATDYAIYRSITPLLTARYDGEQYIFYTKVGDNGVYIAEK